MSSFPFRPADALMARFGDSGPMFKVCDPTWIDYYRERGWFLLANEKEIRYADLDDVRRDVEKGKR